MIIFLCLALVRLR